MKRKKKNNKKFVCIVKVSNDKFVKYRLNNLIKFTEFLDKNWSGWRWFNVYDNKTKIQLSNFTSNNRPTRAAV